MVQERHDKAPGDTTAQAEPRVAAGTEPLPVGLRGLADRPVRGIVFALLGVSGFALMDAVAKFLGEGYPIGQIVFMRNLFALLPLLFLLWRGGGLPALRSRQPGLQVLRGLAGFGAVMTFFTGLRYLGLAEATAIGFAAPLFITALSVPLLGERVGLHRWSAVLLGFVGVLIMFRPGSGSLQLAALLPLAAAFFYGLAMNVTRRLSRTDTTPAIAIYGNLTGLALSLALLPFGWVTPDGSDISVFAALGLLAGCTTYLLSQAYRFAPSSVIAPFDYIALIWAVALGWLIWDELPDGATWTGVAVVIASGLYILYRETRVARTGP